MNFKFMGGMILAISFLIQSTLMYWLQRRLTTQQTAIQQHQYLDIIGRLQMSNYKPQGLPQSESELKKLGAFNSNSLGQIIYGAFLSKKEKEKLNEEISKLHEKITDAYSYQTFHNRIVELDSKYCKQTTDLKKRYENVQDSLIWVFNSMYLLGLVLISIGEFTPNK